MSSEVKSGKETSEYKVEWLSTLISIVAVVLPVVLEMLNRGSLAYVILACVLAAVLKLGSLGYGKSRAIVKAAASQAESGNPQ